MKTAYLQELPADWQAAAGIFSALGDKTRQKILLIFEPEEALSIKEIAALFPLGRTTIAHHLGVLERVGILVVRRQGRLALYQLCHAPVLDALERLRQLVGEDLEAASNQRWPTREKPKAKPQVKAKTQAKTKKRKTPAPKTHMSDAPLKPKGLKLGRMAKKTQRNTRIFRGKK
jgi:DNA-binding transcriptional ArsR family regulator